MAVTVERVKLTLSQKVELFLYRHRLLVLLAVVTILGFALYCIVYLANSLSYSNSCRKEVEALEQKVISLEQSLEKTNGKTEDALDEVRKMMSEISERIAFASASTTADEEAVQLPPLDTSFKSYMDYRTITCVASAQYALQQQAYTDELGLRKIDDFYCVALGTYYSDECGEKFRIITDNGNEFCVIVADIKADEHTDENNMYVPMPNGNANVVEFIVDTAAIECRVALLGDISGYEQFSGSIVKIERL